MRPEGTLNLNCEALGMKESLPFFVAAVESPPIPGLSACQKLKLVKKVDHVAQAPLKKKTMLIILLMSLLDWAAWRAHITLNRMTQSSLLFTRLRDCRIACLGS